MINRENNSENSTNESAVLKTMMHAGDAKDLL